MPRSNRPTSSQERKKASAEQAFGRALRRLRTANKLTQEQLAWTTKMSRVYISEMERGLREPSLTTLLRLADAFGITAATIVEEIEKDLKKSR